MYGKKNSFKELIVLSGEYTEKKKKKWFDYQKVTVTHVRSC